MIANSAAPPTVTVAPPASGNRRRINPWNLFVGAFIANWLLRRREVSQGAKLTYARLAQYAGRDGRCFPRQGTLGAELGVSPRTVRDYLSELERFRLIEVEQPGLCRPNRYFFLQHEWMGDVGATGPERAAQDQQALAAPDRQNDSVPEEQAPSTPFGEETQGEENHLKRENPHSPPAGDSDSASREELRAFQSEQIYQAYPKHVGKPAAVRAIRRALKHHPFEFLLERTRLYAASYNGPAQFIPHPSTWFRECRFNDDPATWRRDAFPAGKPQAKPSPPRQFNQANYQQPVTNF